MTGGERAALRRCINRYRDAAIDDAFKGASHPDDRDDIEANYRIAGEKLDALLKRYSA